jgi:hypothetical protein
VQRTGQSLVNVYKKLVTLIPQLNMLINERRYHDNYTFSIQAREWEELIKETISAYISFT